MTFEELKRYDRTIVRYRGIEGMIYLEGDTAYFLNNDSALSGAAPENDGGMWRQYGYEYSWYISHEYARYEIDNHLVTEIETIPIDYNKLEEILC